MMTDDFVTTRDHVHLPLDEEVTAIGGSYRLVKEERLSIDGREVLYIVGHGVFDTTCCGAGGCAYAIVPGYIIDWKTAHQLRWLVFIHRRTHRMSGSREQSPVLIKSRETIQETRYVSRSTI